MPHLAPRRALIAAAALACAFAAAPASAIYKWVDEKGVTHFSEHPPADGRKATRIEPRVTPPSSHVPAKDWKEREQQMNKLRLEKSQYEEATKAREANQAAARRSRCLRAQRELNVLNRQVPVYSVNEKGERNYLEDKDRPAEIARWQREAQAHCD